MPQSKKEAGEKHGRFAKFGASPKKAVDDAHTASQEQAQHNQESYGNLVEKAEFRGQTVEIYDGGFVRVGIFLSSKSPFEKLRSIKYSQQVQDKSAGGRKAASVASFGLSKLASKEKRVVFLTVATDRKVHTEVFSPVASLHCEDDECGGDDVADSPRAHG